MKSFGILYFNVSLGGAVPELWTLGYASHILDVAVAISVIIQPDTRARYSIAPDGPLINAAGGMEGSR